MSGTDITAKIRRVLQKPSAVIGRFTQPMPNNWKLYAKNVKDTYHVSLLHLLFIASRVTRFQPGGWNHAERGRGAPCLGDLCEAKGE